MNALHRLPISLLSMKQTSRLWLAGLLLAPLALLHAGEAPGRPNLVFTRAALSTCGGQKQIPMCSLQPLTCLQVQVLPRQWMVGPSRDSRLRLGETLAGASSAVNGRVCRRSRVGGDRSAALANLQAATTRNDCRPERASFSETGEEGVLEQPNRDRNGEGS
jgi:hypothetical protein